MRNALIMKTLFTFLISSLFAVRNRNELDTYVQGSHY